MIRGFQESVAKIKDVIEYTFHCNDYNFEDAETKIHEVFDYIAALNGEKPINWDYDEVTELAVKPKAPFPVAEFRCSDELFPCDDEIPGGRP